MLLGSLITISLLTVLLFAFNKSISFLFLKLTGPDIKQPVFLQISTIEAVAENKSFVEFEFNIILILVILNVKGIS